MEEFTTRDYFKRSLYPQKQDDDSRLFQVKFDLVNQKEHEDETHDIFELRRKRSYIDTYERMENVSVYKGALHRIFIYLERFMSNADHYFASFNAVSGFKE